VWRRGSRQNTKQLTRRDALLGFRLPAVSRAKAVRIVVPPSQVFPAARVK
jgi:hypothetical protein